MYIPSSVRHTESCYKFAQCILHHVCIRRKVGTRDDVYISQPSEAQGKLLCITSCYKVAKCIYHDVSITERVVVKLGSLYIITCAPQGKL